MQILDIATILCTGLLIGNELAVSLFINPAIWKLNDRPIASHFAQVLGHVMPIWYAISLVLLIAEGWLRRDMHIYAAIGIWIAIILITVLVLVPINNRVAAATSTNWQHEHKRWDTLHRFRILFLVVAMTCFLLGILR